MYKVDRSAIVSHSAENMFALVNDVSAYEDFLPWCGGSKELERSESEVVASVTIAYKGIRKSFTTRNTLVGQEKTVLQLVDGPFSELYGEWNFVPLDEQGVSKLKEISYIHAEAYPPGKLKHGPLALVDASMPVIAVAPNNELLEKLKSNLQEVRARGGELIVFADAKVGMISSPGVTVLPAAPTEDSIAPIIFSIPLQLLAYHVAVLKGTDIDQPRNLAKSVTVE